jgi:hypothetical protein
MDESLLQVKVSEPIVTFKETIISDRTTSKRKKVKGKWEELSDEDDDVEEVKAEESKTMLDFMIEEQKMQESFWKEREFMRKDQ